jgi:hypothetical protein
MGIRAPRETAARMASMLIDGTDGRTPERAVSQRLEEPRA